MSIVKNADGTFTVNLAVFATDYGGLLALSAFRFDDGEYVQVSESFTATAKALPDGDIQQKQVEALNAQKENLRAEFESAMSKIDCKLSELLCIAHEVAK
jgi:hypothetical protein